MGRGGREIPQGLGDVKVSGHLITSERSHREGRWEMAAEARWAPMIRPTPLSPERMQGTRGRWYLGAGRVRTDRDPGLRSAADAALQDYPWRQWHKHPVAISASHALREAVV